MFMINRILLCLPDHLCVAIDDLMNGEVVRCLVKEAATESERVSHTIKSKI